MFKLLSFQSVTMIIISSLLGANCYTTMSQAHALFDILSPASNNNNNFIAFQDSTLGIKIDYPAGWTHELHAASLVTFLASLESDSNTYPAGLGIKVQHMKSSKNISLNEITKVQIKNLTQSHPDLKLIESTDYKVGGNNAHKIVFTATDDKKNERKAMQIWTLRGDKAYLITYKAEPGKYSRYLPIIQKMVDSFQFTQ